MGNSVKVSIIVPIYNTEKFLQRCIDSLRNQSLSDIEIILVNDGSTDNSLQLCYTNKKLDSRIIVLNKLNGGPAEARNAGMEVATGEYIAFVDSDDWVNKYMYERMFEKAKTCNAEICLCGFVIEKNNIQTHLPIDLKDKTYVRNDIVKKILPRFLGPQSIKKGSNDALDISSVRGIYSRYLLDDNNIRFESGKILAEDLPFNIITLYFANKLCIVNENFYHYFRHEESVQRVYDPIFWDKMLRALVNTDLFIKKMNLSDIVGSRLENRIYDFALRSISREANNNNPKFIKDKLKMINQICESTFLQESINKIDKNDVGVRKKMLINLIKRKNSVVLYIYYVCFNKIVSFLK